MKNKISLNKNLTITAKILISISVFFLTLILTNNILDIKNGFIYILTNSFLAMLILSIILFKCGKEIKINKKILIISSFIALYSMKFFIELNINKLLLIITKLNAMKFQNIFIFLVGFMALPACVFFIYLFIENLFPKVKKFFKKMNNTEKKYLIIMSIIAILFSIFICLTTTAFTKPTLNKNLKLYDIIYTSDSGSLSNGDAFIYMSHAENDIRQPLFGLFAYPFSIVAHFLSNFIFFIPHNQSYEMVMIIIQFLLTTITTIMLSKLLNLKEKHKKYFYLLFSVNFPYMLFNLVLEQYVIALFYLILAIYIYFNYKGINYTYISSVGTLLTSGIIFPLITKFTSIKKWIKDVLKCFFAFVATLIFSGQFVQVFKLNDKVTQLSEFAGKISIQDKIFRFTEFVNSIFFSSPGKVINQSTIPAYHLILSSKINYVGVIIFILMIVSFILNRKDKMAKLSFIWVLFSVVVLFIIGWGMPENGLILYSLYFCWAYLILYFLLIKKIFRKEKTFKLIIISSIVVMFIFNFYELLRILMFAIKFY